MIEFYEPKTIPYAHQKAVLEKSWNAPGWGLLLEMGSGKSKIVIDNIAMLREKEGLRKALIVAPKGTYANWVNKEIPAHLPERHILSTYVMQWKGKISREEELALFKDDGNLKILVMNVEALAMSTKAINLARMFVDKSCMLVVDESSTVKNPQASRTKELIRLSKSCGWRRIASGTPITRSPLDLWSQFEILEPSCLGFRSYYTFRAVYGIIQKREFGGRKVDVVTGYRDVDKLSEKVAERATVLRKEDCLDLPPKVYETVEVELTDEQARLYRELKKWATTEIEAGTFATATEVITQLLRLHQIVCGHIVDENGGVRDIPTKRLDMLSELLSEVSEKTIVWASYRRDVERIAKQLTRDGFRVVTYDGSVSGPDREKAILDFQEGDADVFVATPHTGGYGITLTAARVVIYYSNTYDLEKRLQSEDRAHRIGQTRSVTYIDMVSKGTVDEKILEVLRNKQNLANLVMDGPARIRDLMGTF